MIKKFADYETTKAYTGDAFKLPAGGYICKIIGAKVEDYSWGQVIAIAFDINEGDQKDFYKKQFDANISEDKKWKGTYRLNVPKDDGSQQDAWTKRRFKTFTDALEESNSGYHFDWDETKFKGKLFGATFAETFYIVKDTGNCGTYTAVYDIVPVEKIRKNAFRKIPDLYVPKKLVNDYNAWKAGKSENKPDNDGFMNIPEGVDEEVPF